jgi:hypothetical protein
MFGRGVFLKVKNFHPIVIAVPLHISEFSQVLKKLTAYIQLWHVHGSLHWHSVAIV